MKFYFRTAELLAEESRRSKAGNGPGHDGRPTVVVETEDGDEAVALWRGLGAHGYHVEWCPGPNDAAHRICLLTTTGRCRLVDEADAVLSHLDFSRSDARECLAAVRERYPETPVVVSTSAAALTEHPELADGSTNVLVYPLTGSEVVAAVGEAVLSSSRA